MSAPDAAGIWRRLFVVAACILLVAPLLACSGGDPESASDERVLELAATVHSLEESLEALEEGNVKLESDLAALRKEQADYAQTQETAAEEHEREVADSQTDQEEQLASLEEGLARNGERLEDLGGRLREIERAASVIEGIFPRMMAWFEKLEERLALLEGTVLDRTRRLAEAAGGEVYNIDSRGSEDRSILVMPLKIIPGETPLIVSLHGYGGNSTDHSLYVRLHERVNRDGFGLLLPNGTEDADGKRFWNATDWCCDFGKTGVDDVRYLSKLVARAEDLKDFGPVYFFGHSNGGFMSYRMACEGLPGLRAVASLAGTSYVEDSSCDGAVPVSVLHIHGEKDEIIRFHGSEHSDLPALTPNERYAGAKDMFYRWGRRAGCDLNSTKEGERLDLDAAVEGPETFTYGFTEGCGMGITVEMWSSDEGGHAPVYGDAFVDALLDWLLAQE